MFITLLIKLPHCKENKDCIISFWTDSLRGPALEAAGEEVLPLVCLLVKRHTLGYQFSDNSLSVSRTQTDKHKCDADFIQ